MYVSSLWLNNFSANDILLYASNKIRHKRKLQRKPTTQRTTNLRRKNASKWFPNYDHFVQMHISKCVKQWKSSHCTLHVHNVIIRKRFMLISVINAKIQFLHAKQLSKSELLIVCNRPPIDTLLNGLKT